MASLARSYGLSPVAQALRVNYSGLKRHRLAGPPPQGCGTGTGAPAFVEVPVGAWPGASQWVLELEERDGCKLTLRMPPSASAAVLALAQGLWRHRA